MEETKLDKREAILQATLELVAEHGFHDAPCSLIAERAGVAAGTIYRYFENKDMLILELYRELETKINTALLDGYSLDNPFRERFIHLVTGLLNFSFYTPKNSNMSNSFTTLHMGLFSAETGSWVSLRIAVSMWSCSSRGSNNRF